MCQLHAPPPRSDALWGLTHHCVGHVSLHPVLSLPCSCCWNPTPPPGPDPDPKRLSQVPTPRLAPASRSLFSTGSFPPPSSLNWNNIVFASANVGGVHRAPAVMCATEQHWEEGDCVPVVRLFPRAALQSRYHRLGGLKQQNVPLTVLEPEVRNLSVFRATHLLKTLERDPPGLVQLPVAAGYPWQPRLLSTSLQPLPPSSHGLPSVCLGFSKSLSLLNPVIGSKAHQNPL